MEAPEDSLLRVGVVILNELVVDAQLAEAEPMVRLKEEATVVLVHLGLDLDQTS
jgi:hypothetical protein